MINKRIVKAIIRGWLRLVFTGLVLCFIMLFGIPAESFAGPGMNMNLYSPKSGPNYHPVMIPPPMPPGFPYKWVGNELIHRFRDDGMEIDRVKPAEESDTMKLPTVANEIISFSVPSAGEDMKGYILTFEEKEDLERVKEGYLKMNERGELYTWSFVKDNIVLLLSGEMQEEEVRQYESSLHGLSIKD